MRGCETAEEVIEKYNIGNRNDRRDMLNSA